jgi:hypothetical protein
MIKTKGLFGSHVLNFSKMLKLAHVEKLKLLLLGAKI